ncbi:hypothetical protein [Chamaesiphon sp. VAR_48_metabat_403]|uniref:hypothetical protein n=1 Tax=Chamaesiphon sp. VAR_48_metabat_403 TaxID=2964700 RepID=UPI00286DA5F2|nr:hypothetical protein [Chamaesiphon sp. VAR_48_metabat_403]
MNMEVKFGVKGGFIESCPPSYLEIWPDVVRSIAPSIPTFRSKSVIVGKIPLNVGTDR